ncbi:MAG: sulfatase-like hydrolase/transferase, partial [Gammaproteobacteria bacterium]|nr:sulfatase-like hydrolase/transferase [Gammaproteobacteria bacterium]
ETLQQAGYKTYHIGKWHVGDSIKGAWPSSQGFDHWFGFLNQFLLQNTGDPEQPYSKPSYINPWLQSDKTPRQAYQGHLTDILTEHTVETIETLSNSNEPWFINLWYFAPHYPIQPAKRYSIRYPDTKKGKYYALLEQLDESIGQVLDTLDKFNLTENTIVVLLSDNGGTNHATNNNFPFFGKKATFYEGGVRTPLLISWPGKIAQDKVINNIVSEVDIFPTLSHIAHATTSPTDLDGINLFQHYLSTKPDIVNTLSMRPLFWEIAWEKYYAFSVLSADGKWRVMNKKLFKLEEDYTGSTNVANEHPEVLKKLTNQFFNWQKNATKAEVQFKRSNESTGILIGDSYHRAPADGGFTFSIALKPSNTDINKQTIIEHLGLWSIKHNDKKIEVTIGDVQLSAPSLEINKCSTISVSTYFDATKKSPENRKASYQLYINGKLVTEKEKRLYKNLQDR